jgi:hypothetical protein
MSTPTERGFKIQPTNVLGLEARKSKAWLLQVALQHPSSYIEMRENMITKLLHDFTKNIYNDVFNVLDNGTNKSGVPVIDIPTAVTIPPPYGTSRVFEPKIPQNLIGEVALKVAKRFQEIIEEEVVEACLPQEMSKLALEKTVTRTKLALAS